MKPAIPEVDPRLISDLIPFGAKAVWEAGYFQGYEDAKGEEALKRSDATKRGVKTREAAKMRAKGAAK